MTNIERVSKDFTDEERATLLKQFEASGLKYDEFAREHNINAQTFKNWVWIAKRPNGNRRYSPVERKKIVESFLSAGMPKDTFSKTWGIGPGTLQIWLERYEKDGAEGLMHKVRKPGDRRVGSKLPVGVRSEIVQIKRREPTYGLKKIKHWMYRFRGVKVSTGSVRKTVLAEGLPLVKVKKKRRKSSDRVRRFERARPMQLWQSDITQMTVGQHSMRVYLTVFMDDHSRYIVGWRLQSRQTSDLVMDALKDAIVRFGKPEEVLTDQGRQYFAWRGKSDLEKFLEKENIKHVVSRAHHPQTLGKCERFWETVANEFWTRVRPLDLEEARERLKYFIDHYNHQRPHQGLDGAVPADRFFGIAADVRSAIEKSVVENSLRLSLGELPKPPAFLIGQVGDQRIAFHGTSGSFFLTHENLKGEVLDGNNGANESSTAAASGGVIGTSSETELPTKDHEDEPGESPASDPGSGSVGDITNGGAFTSAADICDDDGILAGSDNEAGSRDEFRYEAAAFLATESAGDFRDECGAIIKASAERSGSSDYERATN
jgi:transposase InsO family protein